MQTLCNVIEYETRISLAVIVCIGITSGRTLSAQTNARNNLTVTAAAQLRSNRRGHEYPAPNTDEYSSRYRRCNCIERRNELRHNRTRTKFAQLLPKSERRQMVQKGRAFFDLGGWCTSYSRWFSRRALR